MGLKTIIGWRNHVTSTSTLVVTHTGAGSSSVVSTLPLANLLTPQLSEACRISWTGGGRTILRHTPPGTGPLPILPIKGMVWVAGFRTSSTALPQVAYYRIRLYNGLSVVADSGDQGQVVGAWTTHLLLPYDLTLLGVAPTKVEIELWSSPDASAFFDVGYLFIGDVWTPEDQSSDGWQHVPFDNSQVDETPTGQFYAARRSTGRMVRLVFDALSGYDMWGVDYPEGPAGYAESYVDLMLAWCGTSRPVVAVPFVDGDGIRPWARPLFGRFVDLQPATKLPGDLFGWTCTLKEHF